MPKLDKLQSDAGSDVISFGPFRLRAAQRILERAGAEVHLSARDLDILIALVDRAGQVVSKRDLIAHAWPNMVIDDVNLRIHVSSLRRALGDGESGARYVTTVPGRGYCFVAPIFRSNVLRLLTTKNLLSPRAHGLPAQLVGMVGRAQVVHEISTRLAAKRFVSIVGPGGIGKTTVAVAIGHKFLTDYEGRVYFLDFGAMSDPSLVPSAVAAAVGLLVQSEDPTFSLIKFLQNQRLVLILDNCEHVIDTAASLAERIFREAPKVSILTTSRETLRVEGEHVHSLMPLDSPPDDPGLTAARALAFPAVQLFLERAAAGGYHFELEDRDAATVGEICRKLDGIALAIELAASRVSAYGLQAMATLLNDRFRLLWEGRRTALLRQQTLSATLDWSYNLLSDREKEFLCRVTVFVGTFTLEAARSVVAGADVSEEEVAAAIGSLVSKSLISANASAGTARYRLLDTTRTYLFKMRSDDEWEAQETARHHAAYYLDLLRRADAIAASTTSDIGSVSTPAEHIGNVRAALEWSFGERGDKEIGSALAAVSARCFFELSLLTECLYWTEQAIAMLDDAHRGTEMEMELQAILALSLMFTRGNSERVGHALGCSLSIAGELGDLHSELRLLGTLFTLHGRMGELQSAIAIALRSAAVAEKVADPVGIAEAHTALGASHHMEGNLAEARFHLEAAKGLPVSHRLDTLYFGFEYQYFARALHARVLWLEGLSAQATASAKRILEDAETADHPVTRCIAFIWAASVLLWNGDLGGAEPSIDTVIQQTDRYSLAPYQAVGRALKGELLVKRGEAESGVLMLRRSLEILHELRHELLTTGFAATMAEGLALLGRFDIALKVTNEAITRAEQNGELLNMPELLRIKGTILASGPQSELLEADVCFQNSFDLAGRQGALAWELRTAISRATLYRRQGRLVEARRTLGSVHGRFTDGFESSDLRTASRMLSELDCLPRDSGLLP